MAMTASEVMNSACEHGYVHFADDQEKMVDFDLLDMDDFLRSYSYLSEEEYRLTLWERQERRKELYHSDRFYVYPSGMVTWMWYNFDSNCGDTFESVRFDGANMLSDALCACETSADVFDYILENGRQYGSNIGDYAYEVGRRMFEREKPFAVGATKETLEKLEEYFGMIPYLDMEE